MCILLRSNELVSLEPALLDSSFLHISHARLNNYAGCVIGHRGQVHRRERQADQGDVQLRQGPPAVHHLHGRDRRHRRKAFQRGNQRRSRDPEDPDGAAQPNGRFRHPGKSMFFFHKTK